ncbi:hypothetical protein ERJ75_001640300 [Trypanosoma vivax]|nr:hypothetical protein ERJ75_001640300 [Trypanosoma vivax]
MGTGFTDITQRTQVGQQRRRGAVRGRTRSVDEKGDAARHFVRAGCRRGRVGAAAGAEAGDPPGLGISEGNNKAADTLCGFGGKLEAAALAAEAVTARLAAGARAAARHAAVLEAARALAPRQAGEDSEARGSGAPLVERLERALLTKARLNEAHSDAADAASALARAAQEVRTLLGVMGSLVDKSSGTTQSCLAKDSGLADAYAGDHNVATHLAKVCSKVFGREMAKRSAEKMAPEDITQALGALAQKEGDSHPENGTCIAYESSADAGDCASNGGGRSTATQVESLLGDASDASECPLLVKAAASKYGLAIKQHKTQKAHCTSAHSSWPRRAQAPKARSHSTPKATERQRGVDNQRNTGETDQGRRHFGSHRRQRHVQGQQRRAVHRERQEHRACDRTRDKRT